MIPRRPKSRTRGAALGLIPFVVPGWPNARLYAESLKCILEYQPVSCEIALPSGGWSARTSEVISRALTESSAVLEDVLLSASRIRPNVAVLYRGLASRLGRAGVLERLRGSFDQLMLEWDAPDLGTWVQACHTRYLGFVHCVDVGHLTESNADRLCASMVQGSTLYLSWAPKTGARTYPIDLLRDAVVRVKSQRPDLYLMAGFGVRTSDHVRRLASIEALDAVAVGTALLEQFPRGARAVDEFFGSLVAAAGEPE